MQYQTSYRPLGTLAIAIAAVFALSACDPKLPSQPTPPISSAPASDASPSTSSSNAPSTAGTGTTGMAPSGATSDSSAAGNDPSLIATIQAAMSNDPDLARSSITIEAVNGRAVLRGTVPNAQAKDNAARIAGGVSGVKEVDNQLSIQG